MNVLLRSSTSAGPAPVSASTATSAQDLVPALVVQEREPPGVGRPAESRRCSRDWGTGHPSIGISLRAARRTGAAGDGNAVAGLEVVVRVQLGLKLVAGRRLDQVDHAWSPLAVRRATSFFESGDQKTRGS